MRLAVMQPYFLPYLGYFQLLAAVDRFVVYDNIKYTKKGWINRNRLLQNGADAFFSLPLKGASDSLDVRERVLAADFDRAALLRQFEGAYRKAPQFAATFPLLETVVRCEESNLFKYLNRSIAAVAAHLGIATPIRISSDVPIDHALRAQDKVLAFCSALGAKTYVNPIGGTELYEREAFAAKGVELKFLKTRPLEYPQFGAPHVPWLSIVDVLMFNPLDAVKTLVAGHYDLT